MMRVKTNDPSLQPYVVIVNDLMDRTLDYIMRRQEESPERPDLSNACWLLGFEEKRALRLCDHSIPFKAVGPDDYRLYDIKVLWVAQRSFSLIVEDAEHPQEKPAQLDPRLYREDL